MFSHRIPKLTSIHANINVRLRRFTIDGSCAPGLFPLVSIPTIVGCVGALLIIIAAIATPIAKTQRAREIWFYVMSGGAVLKIVTMEIARSIL